MRTWLLLGAAVVGAVIVWFVLTDPSENTVPGGMSNHQVDQTFDPYLSESDSSVAGATETDGMPGETDASSSDEAADRESSRDPVIDAPSHDETGEADGERDAAGDPDSDARIDRSPGEASGTRGDSAPGAEGLDPPAARRIADAYLSSAATDPDRLLDQYADRVNYYDEGTVTRSDVLRDKRSYLERWPERSYRRISDVEITDAGAADLIRFTYEFRVSGGSRNAEGRGWAELGVQRGDGGMRIVSERGGVID